MDRFDAMKTFVRVVDANSLSAAARSLPMSLTSVSRQIAALEQQLGTQLLLRTTRSLALTEDGRLFYERARTILGEVRELEQTLSSDRGEPSGRLHVSAPVLMGRLLVAPLLLRFLARHPAVTGELLLLDRAVHLMDENIDLAVRIGALPDSQLIARKLGEVRMVVCAAPAYLDAKGEPQTPDDLGNHDCLLFSDEAGSTEWRFQSPAGRSKVRVSGRLKANSLDVVVAAAKDGAGIVRAPSWQVADDLRSGRLTRILAAHERPPVAVHALFQPARLASARIRLFVDHLAAHWPDRPPEKQRPQGSDRSVRRS
jgi:DNA-binding transcriptional LysR family regulator